MPLAPDYYRQNFEALLTSVETRQGDLLREPERAFLRAYRDCSASPRRLYVRLLMRKGPCFRLDRLAYAEIPAIDEDASALAAAGLIDPAPPFDEALLAARWTLPELRALLPAETPRAGRKMEVVERLLAAYPPEALADRLRASTPWIAMRGLEAVEVFRLAFFGNRRQGLTEFILEAIGQLVHEPVPLAPTDRVFATRAELDAALRLFALGEGVEALFAETPEERWAAWCATLPEVGAHPDLRRWRDRLLLTVARQLERREDPERWREALALYGQTDRPPARERSARILAKLDRTEVALARCEAIAETPRTESEALFARTFGHRLRRRLDLPTTPPPRHQPRHDRLTVTADAFAADRVERVAAATLAGPGDRVAYVENRLFPSLFGLAYWDIIFAPLPGAFCHPFQAGPRDLFRPEFRERRAPALAKRQAELRDPAACAARIQTTYEAKHGVVNRLVRWRHLDAALLRLALERIPTAHLCAIFDRLLFDLQENRKGLPDLIHFPATGGYELIEAKGPGDQLQPHQRRWLQALAEAGAPCRVLDVVVEGATAATTIRDAARERTAPRHDGECEAS